MNVCRKHKVCSQESKLLYRLIYRQSKASAIACAAGGVPCSDNKPSSIVGNSWKNKSNALKALEVCSFLWGGCIKEAYA